VCAALVLSLTSLSFGFACKALRNPSMVLTGLFAASCGLRVVVVGMYTQARSFLHARDGSTISNSSLAAAAAGPVALALGTCIRTPFDIVEQRRQLVSPPSSAQETAGQQVMKLCRHEGVRAALSGSQATFLVRRACIAVGACIHCARCCAGVCVTCWTLTTVDVV